MADVNGAEVGFCRLAIPQIGVPEADLVFAPTSVFSSAGPGKDVLTIGDLAISGTVFGGTFGGSRKARFRAGAGAWGNTAPKASYHNDAGVKAAFVASEVAKAVGETIDAAGLGAARLGSDFVRRAGPAAVTIDRVSPVWRVDVDGVTRFGPRTAKSVDASAYHLLDYDPRWLRASVDAVSLAGLAVGSTITVDDATITIRTLVAVEHEGKRTVELWCGGNSISRSDLGDAIRDIVRAATPPTLSGLYHYRVVAQEGPRVHLQAVNPLSGLPDLQHVEIWTAPGVSATVAGGLQVGVQFLDGDPSKPVVTACGGAYQAEFSPTALDLGGVDGSPVAAVGGIVDVFFPTVVPLSGTVSGAPFVGVATFVQSATGIIKSGSNFVKTKV